MHSHNHSDGHAHSHAPANYNRAFLFGIILNITYIIAEVIFGFRLNSTALLADAGHNVSDVLSLVLSWLAYKYSLSMPSPKYTYGLRRSTILITVMNSVLLFIAVWFIGKESIERFSQSNVVEGLGVSAVAVIGIVVNGLTAFLFFKGSKSDLNIKGAYLHMFADALVSLGVVLSGVIIYFTNYSIIDSITSLVIIAVIIYSSWGLFIESLNLSLDAVPKGIDLVGVQNFLVNFEGVKNVHHLHIWAMSTTENALTVHLVVPSGSNNNKLIESINHELHEKFNIGHTTIQIENDVPCE